MLLSEAMPAANPKPTMTDISTDTLRERPWRAACRAGRQAFQRDCGMVDIRAVKIAERASAATVASIATARRGTNSESLNAAYSCASTMKTERASTQSQTREQDRSRPRHPPLRFGSESRRASKGGVLPAPQAPFDPRQGTRPPSQATQRASSKSPLENHLVDRLVEWGAEHQGKQRGVRDRFDGRSACRAHASQTDVGNLPRGAHHRCSDTLRFTVDPRASSASCRHLPVFQSCKDLSGSRAPISLAAKPSRSTRIRSAMDAASDHASPSPPNASDRRRCAAACSAPRAIPEIQCARRLVRKDHVRAARKRTGDGQPRAVLNEHRGCSSTNV